MLLFFACSEDDNPSSDTPIDSTGHIFNADLINSNNLLESVTLVNATLSDGTTADCYQLVFKSNPVVDGPYCPETIDDIGGVGIYDGNSNPGFQVMKAELWNAIVAKGYTVTDLNAGYKWQKMSFGVQIQNLFNTEWNETQFATESRLQNETDPVEEIHFTPGTPFFIKGMIQYNF